MRYRAVARAAAVIVFITILIEIPASFIVSPSFAQRVGNSPDKTKLMQQSDYKRRLKRQQDAQPQERDLAALATAEEPSPQIDYVVLIILVASIVALVFLHTRNRITRSHL
jgi:hypothetical protein